jgi:hypothetical protein
MRTLTIVCLLCALAFADKDKPKQLSAADQKKYKAALNKGRQLEDKKQYAAAMAAFDEALAVAKDDATALTEYGWTAYLAKDYDKAETYTRRAIANVTTPNVRGAAYYNLGLVQEKKGDRAGAIKSYTESLKARWNATVRGALAKLDPAAAAALDPFKPVAMAGPFKSIDAYCKTAEPPTDDPDNYTCKCTRDDKSPKAPAGGPYDAVEWVIAACTGKVADREFDRHDVAVRVGGDWYVASVADTYMNLHCSNDVASKTAKLDGTRLVVRIGEEGDCMSGERASSFSEDQVVVIGIGASKKPSATPPIFLGRHEESSTFDDSGNQGKASVNVDIKLELAVTKDGVELKGKTKGGDASMVGKHALAFP